MTELTSPITPPIHTNAIKAYHQSLYDVFYQTLKIDKDALEDEDDILFTHRLNMLHKDIDNEQDGVPLGQWFITTCISRYPHITPSIPRDLFWYFGKECLHYVDETEIACFQTLEDQFFQLAQSSEVTKEDYQRLRDEIFHVKKI